LTTRCKECQSDVCGHVTEICLALRERVTALTQMIEGALTYDPLVDCYKLRDWHKRMKQELERGN
jgi:hypothetical protein